MGEVPMTDWYSPLLPLLRPPPGAHREVRRGGAPARGVRCRGVPAAHVAVHVQRTAPQLALAVAILRRAVLPGRTSARTRPMNVPSVPSSLANRLSVRGDGGSLRRPVARAWGLATDGPGVRHRASDRRPSRTVSRVASRPVTDVGSSSVAVRPFKSSECRPISRESRG
jgi:hypothetical protein